jgi:hemoglobin
MTPSRRSGLLDALDDATLTQAISNFTDRILADSRLARFFGRMNLAMLHAHSRSFLLAALSGPELFNGLTLASSHLSLGLTDDDFDRAIGHLTSGMTDAGLPASVVAPIAERLEPLRIHVVAAEVRDRTA